MYKSRFTRAWVPVFAALVLAACGTDRGAETAGSTSTSGAAPAQTTPSDVSALALDFSVSRMQAKVGESVVLDWLSLEAQACAASGDWTGSRSRTGTESISLSAVRVHTFTLSCKSGEQTVARSLSVDVAPAAATTVSNPVDEEIARLFKIIQEFDKV